MFILEELNFDHSYSRLPQAFYQPVLPTPLKNPHLIDFNACAADLINLTHEQQDSTSFLKYMSGHGKIPGTRPLAAVYSGHQFGHYVPELGDGRAISIGEVVNLNGSRWDIQLKGAGLTAFSRMGDGRTVLRSSIREYLCSEAMYFLNIPTTRALCLIGSETEVYRERVESGAILARVAPNHVRFGTFEYFYHSKRPNYVKTLADYLIETYFTNVSINDDKKYEKLLSRIVVTTAQLIAQWQAIGFAHGVMNTDNMSVLGITIDYGPFGFLDTYNPEYISNHSDHQGRYAFNQQPNIALWNLTCLAEAFTVLIDTSAAKSALEKYNDVYMANFTHLMLQKFGLKQSSSKNHKLLQQALELMTSNEVDYTLFFRRLSDFDQENHLNNVVRGLFINRNAFDNWAQHYAGALKTENQNPEKRQQKMDKVNPKYILRNCLAEQAIQKAEAGDFSEVKKLKEILSRPFDDQLEHDQYAQLPPEWSKSISVSCSS